MTVKQIIISMWNSVKDFILQDSKSDIEEMLDMTDTKGQRIKNFFESMEKIKTQNSVIEETIDIKRDNIQKEADTITQLEGYYRKHEYILRMYQHVPIEKVRGMSETEYSAFTTIVNSSGVSGEASYYLHEETKQASSLCQQHYNTVASLNTMAVSDSTSVQVISLTNPDWFPDGERITSEYEIRDEIGKQIDYITGQLHIQFPDLKDEFDSFIRKFQAFRGDRSQYQDLIGSRSMFFFKMIFEFSKQTYGVEYSRLDSIKKFVFGSAPVVASTEPLLRACNNLYRDMSSQDGSGMSVKLGVTSPGYVESLFRRLIGNIATILELRGQYFQP